MDLYVELLKQGDYLIVATVLALSAVFNFPKIADFFKSSRKQRSVSISNAIADPEVAPELKAHFQNELNIEHFRNIHGVKLGLPMLKAALILNERVGEMVSFRHVLKTVKLLPDISGIASLSYRVKLSRMDNFMCLYNLLFGTPIVIFGFVAFLFSLYSVAVSFNPELLITGTACLLMGGYMFNEGAVWASVKHVNKALEVFEEKSAQPDQ